MEAAAREHAQPRQWQADGPAARRLRWRDPRGHPARVRRRRPAHRRDHRPDRHPLRAGARTRCEGEPGHRAQQGDRVRDGEPGRAHPRSHPRAQRHRRRGAEPAPSDRHPRRHPRDRRGEARRAPARSGDGPRHRRQVGARQPRDVPARPHRRRDRRGQVELHQQHRHVDPHARDARSGPTDPRRPEAGRARSVQRVAAPPHRGRRQPEEGRQRARLGRARDGDALRPPRRDRCARHHRLQRDVRPRGPAHRGRPRSRTRPRRTSACRSS